jgi:hypothetical protein
MYEAKSGGASKSLFLTRSDAAIGWMSPEISDMPGAGDQRKKKSGGMRAKARASAEWLTSTVCYG